MGMPIQQDAVRKQIVVKGRFFGARGGSCSCDPCDCNPCHCGDALTPNPPLWRVSGCVIGEGAVGETDLSQLVLLSLAQPREEGKMGESALWEEMLLIDNRATAEQIAVLLAVFEEELESLPAEVGPLPRYQRAMYQLPIEYIADEQRPLLRMHVTQEQLTLVRASEKYELAWPREWVYDGPMALRGAFDLQF